ncbi:hypothetical protein RchiOBHm_Chr5g0058531 [Rosa chinensis]|uniref:Uncharacterized protein n=1 Tax=Rosa chinensis TaxID=74649 RepID=A0A2P6QH77_ROSCH|nr:hypothetical protein RchiOBHm_Chr5g0058531 [Rosa chinensis]
MTVRRSELSPAISENSGNRLICIWYEISPPRHALQPSMISSSIRSSFDILVSGLLLPPSRFLAAGDFSGLSGLRFLLDCRFMRDIVKFSGLLTPRSPVHHQSSFSKGFREDRVGF